MERGCPAGHENYMEGEKAMGMDANDRRTSSNRREVDGFLEDLKALVEVMIQIFDRQYPGPFEGIKKIKQIRDHIASYTGRREADDEVKREIMNRLAAIAERLTRITYSDQR